MTDMERDLRDMMQRTADGLHHVPRPSRGLVNRARIRRLRTVAFTGAAAVALVIGGFTGARSLTSDEALPPANPRPEEIPRSSPNADRCGISAMDSVGSGDPDIQAQLSSKGGTPKAWSPDGSKLLVLRDVPRGADAFAHSDLFVLNADGTETRLTDAQGWITGGSFSPDGAEVVYAVSLTSKLGSSAIYSVDARGGAPRTLNSAGDYFYEPTFSPDGRLIAYFVGSGDWGHSLRVMNSDGTGTRVVLENDVTMGAGHVTDLDWSPDGQRLVFSIDTQGVYVVGIDGSGFMECP